MSVICVDIDGTLLNTHDRVSEANVETLCMANRRGSKIVLATGRSAFETQSVSRQLPIPVYLITCNGALTTGPLGEVIDRRGLARDLAWRIVNSVHPMKVWCDAVFERSQIGGGGLNWVHVAFQSLTLQLRFYGSAQQTAKVAQYLQTHKPSVSLSRSRYGHSAICRLEVTAGGCTKGASLSSLCSYLRVNPTEVIAIGDNYNDREMLDFARHAFLVANAPADLKNERRWAITASSYADGVSQAIRNVWLNLSHDE
jgi:HAD superfamily hydrolase (TIGR01484 family)